MVPVTEIWIQEEEEERWGGGDFELSFRHVELEMPEGLTAGDGL